MQSETSLKYQTPVETALNETRNDEETSTDDECGSPFMCCGSGSTLLENKKTQNRISLTSLVPVSPAQTKKFTMKDLSSIEAELNGMRTHSSSPVRPIITPIPIKKASTCSAGCTPEIKLVKPIVVRRSCPTVIPSLALPERSCNAMCNDKSFKDL